MKILPPIQSLQHRNPQLEPPGLEPKEEGQSGWTRNYVKAGAKYPKREQGGDDNGKGGTHGEVLEIWLT